MMENRGSEVGSSGDHQAIATKLHSDQADTLIRDCLAWMLLYPFVCFQLALFCGFNVLAWYLTLHCTYDDPFSVLDDDDE